jgi:predicted AAA+ superfamily ATPase
LIEQIIRNLPPFRRFLEVAARQETEVVSYSSAARDILVDPKIVSNFYSILEDTLLGFFLQPFHH